jgi:Carboxypeptidase regulatory-like domain
MMRPEWIRNQWIVVPVVLAAGTGLWNLYVMAHAGGRIEGRVVDASEQPVAGAEVLLLERGFVAHNEKAKVKSDAVGLFRFDGNQSHALQLEAQAPGLGRSDRQIVRLWFRAQNTRVAEPLRLPGRQP